MKKIYIYDVQFHKASRGWVCEIAFRVRTERQSTMEDHTIRGHGVKTQWMPLGLVTAFINARYNVRAFAHEVRSILGDWNLDGTPKRKA